MDSNWQEAAASNTDNFARGASDWNWPKAPELIFDGEDNTAGYYTADPIASENQVAIKNNDSDEDAINSFIATLPCDTFSASSMKLRIENDDAEGEHIAMVQLPPACAVRGTFQSGRCKTATDARRQVCAQVVDALQKEGQLDAEARPTSVPLVPPTEDVTWPHVCPSQLPLEALEITRLQGEAEWPTQMVLTLITLTPEQPDWNIGCLSAHASPAETPGFALQFELGEGNPIVRIEPTVIPWPPSPGATAHMKAYNWVGTNAILPGGPDTVAVVPLVRGNIDWARICSVTNEDKAETVPLWLDGLCKRLASIQRLQQLARHAPIGPVPNALRMEAVLSAGVGAYNETFQALTLQGQAVLNMLFAVAFFAKHTSDDARRLEHRVKAALNSNRLATLIVNSNLLQEVVQVIPGVTWLPRNSSGASYPAASAEPQPEIPPPADSATQTVAAATNPSVECQNNTANQPESKIASPADWDAHRAEVMEQRENNSGNSDPGARNVHGDTTAQLRSSGDTYPVATSSGDEHPSASAVTRRQAADGQELELRRAASQNEATGVEHLLRAGTPPNLRNDGVECAVAEQMLFALIGAYAEEKGADIYSVVELWRWLTGSDELMMTAHYLGCAATEYKGRTSSYEYFKQVEADDGTLELHVHYINFGLVRYRRPDKHSQYGQYQIENGRAEWCSVSYDYRQQTYVWNAFQVEIMEGVDVPAPLPNKVQLWLRGTRTKALMKYKRCPEPSMVHTALQEKEDGSLHVHYKDYGWYCYTRCPKGGLGFEVKVSPPSEKKPVFYSEKPGEKTLFSPHHVEQLLPNKVTEWLMTGKSLFQLMSIDTTASDAEDYQVTEQEDDHICWELQNGEHWRCVRKHVGCSIVFLAGKENEDPKELMYLDRGAQTEDQHVMPQKVMRWLKKPPDRACNEKIFKAYLETNQTVCTPVPMQINSSFPQLPYTDLHQLQFELHHDFSNRMLLAEALLQTSGNASSMTPDFQRLAFVGNAVAQQLVARILVENAPFSTSATLVHHDDADKARTFAVGPNATLPAMATNRPTYQWPEKRGGLTIGAEWPTIAAIDLKNIERLRKRLQACCNNVAYARTAVKLGLHKGMLHCTPELQKSVRSFAKVVERSDLEFENNEPNPYPWHRLLKHDAPRALGNTLIACLGAIVMDGAEGGSGNLAYSDARHVLVDHVHDCKTMPIDERVLARPKAKDDMSASDLVAIIQDARHTLNIKALLPPPPSAGHTRDPREPIPVPTAYRRADEMRKVYVTIDGSLL